MAQAKLEKLVQSIYHETKAKWREYSKSSRFIYKYGYWVLVGPPKFRPPVFIVSSNPGASRASMEQAGPGILSPKSWPERLNYLRRISPFANKLSDVFDGVPSVNVEDCCAGYGLFFRSKDLRTWKNEVPGDIRRDAEAFSMESTKEILDAAKPGLVLTVGKDCFKKFSEKTISSQSRPWGSKTIDLLKTGEAVGIPVLGVPHLSGARLSRDHMAEIASEITNAIT
jgi:hypothetical protein